VPDWAGWIVVAVVCGIAEILTPTFFIAWFGVGAIFAALLSTTGLSLAWQIGVFLAVSLALVLSTKRLSAKWFRVDRERKTNVNALEGASALVTKAIPEGGAGQVGANGEIWTATAQDRTSIPAGVEVTVVRVDGVHLVVRASDTIR
jgi:membrane protein implicated in regulation of membrane protease activity